jgi:DNA-binding beta-propeller fold protein YncE
MIGIGISLAFKEFAMTSRTLKIALLAFLMVLPVNLALAEVTASFRYPLSNFEGPVLSQWAKLAVDSERNEIYALHQRKNDIRIFDEHGMEIFVFAEGFGSAADIAIGDDGDIFVLSRGYQSATVHLLDYRGEQVAEIPLQGVPAAFSKFAADHLVHRNSSLYLVDSSSMQVIVVDEAGRFKKSYDLSREIKPYMPREELQRELTINDWRKKKLEDIDLNGFTVDDQGNLFFTVPVLFSAFKLSPRGELRRFGKSGSAKGKFGVVAGIATDDMGYIYVSDRLRSVVLVFDRDLMFQTEFGYRGDLPSNLIVPDDLAIDSLGNVYVGQAANRGVSVFKVVHQDTSPPQAGESMSINHEESGRIIEEVEIDRLEFVVDQGSGTASTDSGDSSRNTEAVESQYNEVNDE